jgi:undecaprenyl-diphosphatase
VPFSLLSFLGSAEVTTLILLALLIRAHPAQRLPLLAAFGIMTLIELAGKSLISQPIPPHELVRTILFFSIPSGALKTAYAFPSGHAARTTFIVIVLMGMVAASPLAARTKKWEYASLCLIEALMLVSRVYLVEHWLSDVVGGALLGGAFALIALDWKIKPPHALGRNF